MSVLGKVKDIYIYPIKSFSGIKLDKCYVTKYGIAHPDNRNIIDRKWMVVSESGSFLTQRQLPKMVLIKPKLVDDFIVLSAPDKEDLKIPLTPPTKNLKKCRVWNLHIDGYGYGGEISKWLSEFLEKENLDLVCFGEDLEPRKSIETESKSSKARETDQMIYEDFSPFMIMTESSINDLNTRLNQPVSVLNFRPNFLVTDCEPYAEDNWVNFKIGEIKFVQIKHCTRCLLTTVDPQKGVKDPNLEPLKTLKEYRSNKEVYGVSPMLGINCASDNYGYEISVGDLVVSNDPNGNYLS